jgi:TPR repeat protein
MFLIRRNHFFVVTMLFLGLGATAQTVAANRFDDLVKKAEAGDAEAQFQLGRVYDEGDGIPQDDESAVKWYKKSAEQGNAKAENSLGIMYDIGQGVLQDKQEAARWFLKAADRCDPNGAYNLAIAYYNGDGVVSDAGFAFVWLLVAKQCGNSKMQSTMDRVSAEITAKQREIGEWKFVHYLLTNPEFKPDANSLLTSIATDSPSLCIDVCKVYTTAGGHWRSDENAQHWCQKAATTQHDWEAYIILGNLAEGKGNNKEAFELYQKAENHYPGLGAEYLGPFLLEGKGVGRDPAKAYFWLYLAVKKYSREGLQSELDLAHQQISEKERRKQEKRAEKRFAHARYD